MRRWTIRLVLSLMIAVPLGTAHAQQVHDGIDVARTDWPWWRGPARSGQADPDQNPPLTWSETQHVAWKTPLPGRGHSSPIISGDHVYLSTCDEDRGAQLVLCLDRASGAMVWQQEVHADGAMRKHPKSSGASSSLATDGERVFVSFPNHGAVITTALSRDGKQLWQTRICDYVEHQGYGASPAIYQSLVIIAADNKAGGALVGLDRVSGQQVWRRERPQTPNYTSPIILNVAGRDQLLLTGCDLVSSFNPLTGETLWEVAGATTECVTSTVTDGKHIYSTGGYPRNHVTAIVADGSGVTAWERNSRLYVPSLLLRDGYLYVVMDNGVAACWESHTGEQVWQARLGQDTTASPVMVGDKVFATDESGVTHIFRASPAGFERLGENKLGDEAYASPVVCGDRVYLRAAHRTDSGRQEMLYCLAQP